MSFQQLWNWFLVSVLSSFLFGAFVEGQETPPPTPPNPPVADSSIFTDRPTETVDSRIVSQGTVQLEMGFSYRDWGNGSDEESVEAPEFLARYGLNDRWELRLGWGGYSFRDIDDNTAQDISAGFKWQFKSANEALPGLGTLGNTSLALITNIELPTGSNAEGLDYAFLLGWNKDLTQVDHLSGTLGLGIPTDEVTDDHFAQGKFSVTYTRDILANTSVFGEYYTNFPAAEDEDAEHVIQTGVLHRIAKNVQVDCHVGFGLNDQADDWTVGVGFAYAFGTK